MPNTYQRGTDLKHCPDGCAHVRVEYQHGYFEELRCTALNSDTCPREQAEKPAIEACSTCSERDVCEDVRYYTCELVEHTND